MRARLEPVGRMGGLPVSHTQEERLVAGAVHLPNNVVAACLELSGPLDDGVLGRALDLLVARHENLRVTFPDGRVRIADGLSGHVHRFHAANRDDALTLVAEVVQAGFDLASGPLFRAVIVRVDRDLHLLGLSFDHIIGDGRSREVLLSDLVRIYHAEVTGAPGLPDLPVQFIDFAAWERAHLTGPVLDRLAGYWRKTLSGIEPIPASGLVDPAAEGGDPRADKIVVRTPPDLTGRLGDLATQRRATHYGIVSAAVKCAMAVRAGPDAAVYASAGNRLSPQVAEVFGYFATPIVLRTDLSGDPTMLEVLARETTCVLGALRHQQLPHSLITKELCPALYGARHRVDQSAVPQYLNFDFGGDTVHMGTSAAGAAGGLSMAKIALPMLPVPRGGLRVLGARGQDAITIEVRYREDLYSRSWARSFADDIQRFLFAFGTDPSVRMSAVEGK